MHDNLQEFYQTYSQEIYRYFYRLTLDPDLSEDLTSEVFLEAVKSLHTFRADSSMKTWLYTIARHCWYHYLRRKKIQPPLSPDSPEWIADERIMENYVADQEEIQRIRELLNDHPPRSQEVMKLRMQGFSYYEIGLKLKISENSARVIEFRTRAKIKQILKEEGFADE